ncbi:MAG: MotE family protein [Amphiplicatus sp.]
MTRGRPRVLPVVILAMTALLVVKTANLWVGFSSAEAAPDEPPAEEAPAAPPASPTEAEKRILEQLAARRAELETREEAVATREALLEIAARRIETRLADLAAEEEKLRGLRAEKKAREDEEFEALASAYERMKARDAARIFELLDEDVLVPVASGMRTQALAGVLAEMNPEKARFLTRLLADRRREANATQTGPQ